MFVFVIKAIKQLMIHVIHYVLKEQHLVQLQIIAFVQTINIILMEFVPLSKALVQQDIVKYFLY